MTSEVENAGIETQDIAASECEQALALLRQQGADQWKPVDFHYMEAMARRSADQTPDVRRILAGKLQLALAAYQTRFENAQRNSAAAPHQANAAQPLSPTALGQLVQAVAHPISGPTSSSGASASSSRAELKSVSNFRNTWSKLSAQKQVAQALGQAPKNAGPINSHMLVLRSLELMRDISPDYLNRFMSYADTLLCLDQRDLSAKVPPAKPKPLASAKPKAKPPARS